MEWVATYKNPKMGETNTYLVTDEVLLFMDDVVYVDKNDNTKVIDPKRFDSVGNTIPVKCLWLHDMNKGHDTLRRTWLGLENNLSI
jgi:hypothetical protein